MTSVVFRATAHITYKLIFDVAVPYELKYSDAQLRDLIGYRIREIDPSDVAVITVDRV